MVKLYSAPIWRNKFDLTRSNWKDSYVLIKWSFNCIIIESLKTNARIDFIYFVDYLPVFMNMRLVALPLINVVQNSTVQINDPTPQLHILRPILLLLYLFGGCGFYDVLILKLYDRFFLLLVKNKRIEEVLVFGRAEATVGVF